MLNLLPLQQKGELLQEERWKLSLILGILILIFLLFLILFLLSIKFTISSKVQSEKIIRETEEKEFEKVEIQNLRGKIVLINQNLAKLVIFYEEQTHLTGILEKISGILAPEMYLTSLSYQEAISKISLSGFAPTREILFDFQKNLEKEFKNVDFPPKNWVKPTNIDFQATFEIEK